MRASINTGGAGAHFAELFRLADISCWVVQVCRG